MKISRSLPLPAHHDAGIRAVTLFVFLSLAILLGATTSVAQQAGSASPEELVKRLQSGGLILYVRHAATDHSQSDLDLTDFSDCSQQRNLSEQGKQESLAMRMAIQSLNIPIGNVYTSPYCRCVDTAKIVFEQYEILQDLRATFYTDEADTQQLGAFLREQLGRIPEPGVNTVLVGHTANLKDVTKVWPKPEGVAHIFEPLGNGQFKHLGRIEPTLWPGLSKGS